MKRIVAYYRVSTKKQGVSGLGLEGQKAAVAELAKRRAANLLSEYTEIESGKRKDRPELAKALAHARRSKATLVVAKLDRLARNVAFLSALMESNADFVACDMEHANRLTIHILAAVAEAEAKAISERTKTALAAAKARGTKLGSSRPGHWDGREDARLRGAKKGSVVAKKARSEAADAAYADLYGRLKELRADGQTLRQIADDLNSEGHTTRRGKPWSPTQVLRVIQRAA
jgi:DNA invertase Pin-like site-specific DNA recombinase